MPGRIGSRSFPGRKHECEHLYGEAKKQRRPHYDEVSECHPSPSQHRSHRHERQHEEEHDNPPHRRQEGDARETARRDEQLSTTESMRSHKHTEHQRNREEGRQIELVSEREQRCTEGNCEHLCQRR